MAMHQYIGARYVPKFHDGSSGTDWTANTQYEALTIVTRNGNSYTSKKPVPAAVGAPESNPDYWASTGIFNAQLQDLQDQIDALNSAPLNVLTLGVKNDGSEDCTTIINNALLTNALYFPAGVYRFDGTITAYNSIYGVSNTRERIEYGAMNNSTTLKFTTNQTNIYVPASDVAVNLKGFNILREWTHDERGIYVTNLHRVTIEDITIYGASAGTNSIALDVRHSSNVTRGIGVRNIVIMGEFSYGINIVKSSDSFIHSAELMFTVKGISLDSCSFTSISNIHVWCGAYLPASISDNRWKDTRGLILISSYGVRLYNIYTDTCFIDMAVINGSALIDLWNSWMDTTYDGVATTTSGQLLYTANNRNVHITNLLYKESPFKTNGLSMTTVNDEKTVLVYTESAFPGSNTNWPVPSGNFQYDVPSQGPAWNVCALLRHTGNGYSEFYITENNNVVRVIESPHGTFKREVITGSDIAVKYKTVTGTDGNSNIAFYIPGHSAIATISGCNYGQNATGAYGLVDLENTIDNNSRASIALPGQADATGLTDTTLI